jgi:hypothetical protein
MPASVDLDKWTEDISYWNSNTHRTTNTKDYISGIYYGNKSIEFSLNDSSQIWMELNIPDPLNCSGPEGYRSLTFRVKILKPPSPPPSNVSIYLFSVAKQDSFYQDITDKINSTGIWNNVTLSLGQEWKQIKDARWNNITGLKFEFTWPSKSNITLLIDGLFFHGVYKSRMETEGNLIAMYSINAFMQFTIYWVLLGGMLYLIPKMFGVKTVWKPLLVSAGFILITYFIRMIVFTFVYITSQEIYLPLTFLGGVPGEGEEVYAQIFQTVTLPYQIMWVFDKIVWVWITALCAIVIRLISKMSWVKSFIASTSSYLLYVILVLFLVPGALSAVLL